MIIDVKSLILQGKQQESFDFTFTPDEGLLSLPGAKFLTPCSVNVLVEVFKDEVYLSGNVRYEVSAPCSRCLKETTQKHIVDFDERFLPSYCKDQVDDPLFLYDKDKIDLSIFINQLILTDMPLSFLCNQDCKGLCPVCGQDLNQGDCGHDIENNY